MSVINSVEMLRAFEVAMTPMAQLPHGTNHIIVGMQPRQLAESTKGARVDPAWLEAPRFRMLSAAIGDHRANPVKQIHDNTLALVKSASSDENALETIISGIAEHLSRLLMISVEDIRASRGSIANIGLDSMIGLEFRNWIFRELGVDVPFQKLLASNLTVTKLAVQLLEKVTTRVE
jgi:hypothetical protein